MAGEGGGSFFPLQIDSSYSPTGFLAGEAIFSRDSELPKIVILPKYVVWSFRGQVSIQFTGIIKMTFKISHYASFLHACSRKIKLFIVYF